MTFTLTELEALLFAVEHVEEPTHVPDAQRPGWDGLRRKVAGEVLRIKASRVLPVPVVAAQVPR